MIYKLNNGGTVKLQKAGSVPEYGNIEQIAKYNREHGTHFWKMSQVLEHDKQQAQQKTQDKKKSFWEILAGHPESAGEAILNKTIETANNTELPETRSKIYNDTGKAQLTTTAGSLLALPMLGEFSTYGLLGGAARLAGGFGGSAVGSYTLGKVGELGDSTFGTTWMKPAGQIIGGFAGWGPGSNIAYKGALDLASKAPSIARIGTTDRFIGDVAGKSLGNSIDKTTFIPAQVKYYGPTMGKSYAARNNTRHPWESIEHGEEWWDSLQGKGTPLSIDNRFVSDIEGNKIYAFTNQLNEQSPSLQFDIAHYNALLHSNISDIVPLEKINSKEGQVIRDIWFKRATDGASVSTPQFHSTDYNFWTFDLNKPSRYGPLDAYVHVGTENAAKDIGGKRMVKLYINLKNPLKTYDGIQDSSMNIINEIANTKHLSDIERNSLFEEWRNALKNVHYDDMQIIRNKKARELLSRYGFDGIEYINKNEDIGSISRGLIAPEQLKLTAPFTSDESGLIPISRRDNFHNPDIRYKSGGILKGQHGILTPWYKAYNSKVGEFVRNLMFGKDHDLSDEEYIQKYGYAKPITGTGMLPGKTSMNAFEGVENLVKGSFGTGAKYNSGLQAMKTKAASKLVEPKTTSNWDKFLKKSLDEQNKIVKYWDERYSTIRQLQANQKQFKRFVNWINKQ